MAVPAFRAAGAMPHGTTDQTPGAPAGLATDDIELLVVESQAGTHALTTANGFAQLGNQIDVPSGTASIATHGSLWWRRYAGQADPVVTVATNHIVCQRYAFSGCITTGNPWDINIESSEATEDTSGSATGGTTTVVDTLVAVVVGSAKPNTLSTAEISSPSNASLTSLTERADNAGNSGNGGHVGLFTGEKASAGIVDATTYTKATAAFKWHYVIALKPPVAGPTTHLGSSLLALVIAFTSTGQVIDLLLTVEAATALTASGESADSLTVTSEMATSLTLTSETADSANPTAETPTTLTLTAA